MIWIMIAGLAIGQLAAPYDEALTATVGATGEALPGEVVPGDAAQSDAAQSDAALAHHNAAPTAMKTPRAAPSPLPAPARNVDTTFATPAGARIEIENFAGDVVVRTWDRNAVRVVASRPERDRIQIRTTNAVVRIESGAMQGASRIVDYEVTIPASAGLRVSGPFADVSIDGAGGDITVETVNGDIRVRGGNGQISLRSVKGSVSLEGARGRIFMAAVNDGIRGVQLDGDITAETINGDVRLERIQSSNVSASTINGALTYEGTIRDQGRYALTTHNGDLVLVVPVSTNAAVSIATFNGKVESALPITLTEISRGRRFRFTVGNGSARIDLESFNGTVHLKRPGGAQT